MRSPGLSDGRRLLEPCITKKTTEIAETQKSQKRKSLRPCASAGQKTINVIYLFAFAAAQAPPKLLKHQVITELPLPEFQNRNKTCVIIIVIA